MVILMSEDEDYYSCSECEYDKIRFLQKQCPNCGNEFDWSSLVDDLVDEKKEEKKEEKENIKGIENENLLKELILAYRNFWKGGIACHTTDCIKCQSKDASMCLFGPDYIGVVCNKCGASFNIGWDFLGKYKSVDDLIYNMSRVLHFKTNRYVDKKK